jgi:hypothetical protein
MTITIKENELIIEFSFWESLWSLHGNFHVPKGNIVSIGEGGPKSSWFDLRIPGTFLPGFIKAGTFYTRRGREFWYVTRNHPRIYTIELTNMSYRRLIVGTNQKIA